MARASLNYNAITSLPQNFWDKVEKTESCWFWRGKVDDGYGRFYIKGHHYGVHQLSLRVLKNEEIIPGLVVDHTCHKRNCCNPDHLEQVTHSQNSRRRVSVTDLTVCVNGHSLIGEDAETHISTRRTRHSGDVPSVTCKVCNSVRRLDKVGE